MKQNTKTTIAVAAAFQKQGSQIAMATNKNVNISDIAPSHCIQFGFSLLAVMSILRIAQKARALFVFNKKTGPTASCNARAAGTGQFGCSSSRSSERRALRKITYHIE